MDPNQTYSELLEAIRTQDHETARELATALRQWLLKGGFYPAQYSFDAVNHTVAVVLDSVEGKLPFSLTCWYCDAGQGILSKAEAQAEGWIEIEPAPQLLQANFLGVCPECRPRHES